MAPKLFILPCRATLRREHCCVNTYMWYGCCLLASIRQRDRTELRCILVIRHGICAVTPGGMGTLEPRELDDALGFA